MRDVDSPLPYTDPCSTTPTHQCKAHTHEAHPGTGYMQCDPARDSVLLLSGSSCRSSPCITTSLPSPDRDGSSSCLSSWPGHGAWRMEPSISIDGCGSYYRTYLSICPGCLPVIETALPSPAVLPPPVDLSHKVPPPPFHHFPPRVRFT